MRLKFYVSGVLFVLGISFLALDIQSLQNEDFFTWNYHSYTTNQSPTIFLQALAEEMESDLITAQVDEAGNESENDVDVDETNALTIYNQNMALVKQVRDMSFEEGRNEVSYRDVPKQIQSNTVFFEDLTDSSTRILEQSYEYDLVSGDKLFEKFIDKEITVTVQQGDETQSVKGILLSTAWGDVVLQTDSGIKTIQKGHIIDTEFDTLPEGFSTRPTLVWTLWAEKAGMRKVRTSYLTRGLSWNADYVVVVDDSDTQLSLQGWTTITNHSGASFPDTKLQLVAGDVNVVSHQRYQDDLVRPVLMNAKQESMDMGGFAEESFFEYHLYSLDRVTDIKENAQKQIELFHAHGIEAKKEFVYDPQKNHSAVRSHLSFQNEEENNLGVPIPKGTLRVYKRDSKGSLQFIGEDMVNHTPRDEEIEVFLGNVFDIAVEKKQLKYETTKNWIGFRECSFATHEVELRNQKDDDVVVQVYENVWGANIEIQKATVSVFASNKQEDSEDEPQSTDNVEFELEGDGRFIAEISVPSRGKSLLHYMVQSCR